MPSFDANLYTTVPTRTPAGTMSLARGLLACAASRPNRTVAARLTKVRERASELQQVWIDANRPEPAREDARPYDLVLDRAWTGLRSRLLAWAQLDADLVDPRAAELDARLFPTGLDFLRLRFVEQWAQSERRLVQIDADGLADDVHEVAGEPFLIAVRRAHADYGRVLGITDKKAEKTDPARVLEPLQALRDAIASYARAVVGLTDEEDQESVAVMKSQLRPMIDIRRPTTPGAGRSKEETDEPIDRPLPEVGEPE